MGFFKSTLWRVGVSLLLLPIPVNLVGIIEAVSCGNVVPENACDTVIGRYSSLAAITILSYVLSCLIIKPKKKKQEKEKEEVIKYVRLDDEIFRMTVMGGFPIKIEVLSNGKFVSAMKRPASLFMELLNTPGISEKEVAALLEI